jgi:indole-3-glycerol phosphate synthase
MNLPEGSLLQPFVAQRLEDLKKAKAKRSMGQMQGKIGEMPMTRGFHGALAAHFAAKGEPGVIAEIKGASPFEKNFRRPVNYRAFAEDFEAVGAACLSVAIERKAFAGSVADLASVNQAVQIPILARDIVVDLYQVLEARHAGADAIALSVALLGDELADFIQRATAVALDAFVEVHTEAELALALAAGADLIAVTNRDIHTFELKPATCAQLLPKIPSDKALAIAQGDLGTAEDIAAMGACGAKAVLMGLRLMKDRDPAGVLEGALGIETLEE